MINHNNTNINDVFVFNLRILYLVLHFFSVYSMTRRSWKPDFSLADTVPGAQAEDHLNDLEIQNLGQLVNESIIQYTARNNTETVSNITQNGSHNLYLGQTR